MTSYPDPNQNHQEPQNVQPQYYNPSPSNGQNQWQQPDFASHQPTYGQQYSNQQPNYGQQPGYDPQQYMTGMSNTLDLNNPYQGAEMSQERNIALLCWLSQLFGGFLGPLIVYFMARSGFVRDHARQALNACICFAIGYFGSLVLAFFTFGLGGLLCIVPCIFALIWIIQGAVKASNGEVYHNPPALLQFLK